MIRKTAIAPTVEEKFNGASALAEAVTSIFAGIIGDLRTSSDELGEVIGETSEEIDRVRDAADAEIARLTLLREEATTKVIENGVVIENLRRLIGD